ncbi:MAG: putative internalin [Nitrospira sp.]|nr:putative internalin [Nitrospira sp.]
MSGMRNPLRHGLTGQASLAIAALVLMVTAFLPDASADISYVYDDAGRLRAVIDPATNTAIYAYDAVGNLTGITQQASSTLALFQFMPSASPIGSTVTLYGTGFSATPASNTVKFNGTTATVLTASTTVLTATVPSGATTGSISVTVGANTATSAASFTVGSGAPTLASFGPAVGNYGATVTLTGTNYDTTPINNRVAFTAAMGAVSTATSTTITVPVPSTAQTGPISVSTIQGTATSSTEFYVAPPDVVSTDVQYTGRVAVDGSTVTASITTANKTGLMVFDGTAGQRISVGFSGVTISQFAASVYRPDGVSMTVLVPSFSTGGGSIDLDILPLTGTYTIVLDPVSTYTGNISVTVSTELTGTITPGGAAVPISITRVGQNARYTFTGTSGQTISLGVTSVTMASLNVSIFKPDGTALVIPTPFTTSGGAIDSQVLPVSGTYTMLVDPSSAYTGNVTLTLYNQPDVTGSITIDGATVSPTLTVPGQRARYTFTGTAGQWVNLGMTSVTISASTVSMLKPDGTTLASTFLGTSGGSLDPTAALPTTGTYTIVVDPSGLATGNMTLTLTSPLTGTITLDGAAVPLNLTKAGQTVRYIFTGTSGQWLSLGLTSVTISSSTVTLLKPDGTTLAATTVGTSGGGLEPPNTLPTTGTYTIVVDPAGTNTGNMTLTLMSYLSDTLNLNGTPTTTTITPIGRNALYIFTGTAGQWVSLGMTSVTIPLATVTFWKPDGTQFASTTVGTSGGSLDAPTALPTTGTYTVTVNPAAQYTGTITLTLSTEVSGSVTINAAATPITIGRAGQNARYTFAGTASQQVTVKITGNTLGSVSVNLYTPSGSYQTGTTNSAASFNLSTVTLSTTGTYTVTINPQTTATGSLSLQVTSP